jgi:hypothetical protein
VPPSLTHLAKARDLGDDVLAGEGEDPELAHRHEEPSVTGGLGLDDVLDHHVRVDQQLVWVPVEEIIINSSSEL